MSRKWLMYVACVAVCSAVQPQVRAQGVSPEPRDEAATVFDETQVRTFELTIAAADLARINNRPSAEEWVRGTLKYQGKTYGPVGVRYKGSVGAFLYPCTNQRVVGPSNGRKVGRCSIKIGFDKYDKNLRFFGQKSINLHAMGRDLSRLKERIGYSLYREMGVAAPRAMHARVTINGELEGLYLAVEQIDGNFTESRFTDGGEGNLYKEVWPIYNDANVYRNALETNKGSNANVNKMLAFKRAIDSGASAASRFLDRDYMLRYLAVDRLIVNDDGFLHWYCGSKQGNNQGSVGNHNYYWYEGATSDRFWLIPWDLDSSFTENNDDFVRIVRPWFEPTSACGCSLGAGFSSQRAAYCDKLTSIMAGWKTDYEAMVDQFIRGPFSAARMNAKLDAWTAQLRPYIEEAGELDHSVDLPTWREYLTDLRRIINESRVNRGFWY